MWVTNLKILFVVLGTLGVYTLVASSIPQVASEVPEELSFSGEVSPAELVSAGEELYAGAGQCVSCHGLGTRAPNLITDHAGEGVIGQRCANRVSGQGCKAYLYESLTEPSAHLVPGFDPIMPDMRRTLSETQIWALVAYLEAQGGEVTVTAADIESTVEEGGDDGTAPQAGGAVGAPGGMDPVAMLENNLCLNCHTHDGVGVELGPSFDGIGARVDADYLRTSILDPNAGASEGYESLIGVMPTNFGEQFSAAQLETLVQYLAGRQ